MNCGRFFILTCLIFWGCNVGTTYRIPSGYRNSQMIKGTTKVFRDTINNECLAIFEKIVLSGKDTSFIKVEFNNTQVFDSTYSKINDTKMKIILKTDYGMLDGIEKIIDRRETTKSHFQKSEVNFADKVLVTSLRERTWMGIDSATLVEVSKTTNYYFDRLKDQRWEARSVDSIYFSQGVGLTKMKLFFVEENHTITFLMSEQVIGPNRPTSVDCR
jgi:hypothetical protein